MSFSPTRISDILDEVSRIYTTEPERGLALLDEAESLALESGATEKHARTLLSRSHCLATLSRYDEAIAATERAEEAFEVVESRLGVANALTARGICHRWAGRQAEGLGCFNRALEIFTELDDPARIAATQNNIGSVHEQIGNLEEALEAYQGALGYYSEQGPERFAALVTANVANVYYGLEDRESCEEWLREGLGLAEKADDPTIATTTRLNLASVLRERGAFDESRELLEVCIDHYRSSGDRRLEGAALTKLGQVEFEQRRIPDARASFDAALAIFREVEADREVADLLLRLGEVAVIEEKLDEALEHLNEGLRLCEKNDDIESEAKIRDVLAQVHAALDDHAEAFRQKERVLELYRAIKSRDHDRTVAEMTARFAVDRAELRRRHAEERATEQEELAEERSRQLNATAMSLIRKNSLLQSLRDEIDDLNKALESTDNARRLRKVVREIEESIRADDDWDRFEQTYRLVHHDFIQRLSDRYSELSPTELKVCALLHIDLSNKEIAEMLCVSLRTVESHRYNVRKKLGLTGRSNLSGQIDRLLDDSP